MHNDNIMNQNKEFVVKVLFFLSCLIATSILYFENHMIIDIVYFVIVLIMFIRFLIIELYP